MELDTARVIKNQDTNDTLIEMINETLRMLDLLKNSGLNRKTEEEKTQLDENIKLVEEKMENCLNLLKGMKTHSGDNDANEMIKMSYDQANIFIYFVETLSLQAGPKRSSSAKDNSKAHFAQYYSEEDTVEFNRVRNNLLHPHGKKFIQPGDIEKRIKIDIKDFFKELERYIENIQCVKEFRDFLIDAASEFAKPEHKQTDFRSFLDKKFDEKSKDSELDLAKFYSKFKAAYPTSEEFDARSVDSYFIKLQPTETFFLEKFDLQDNMGENMESVLKSYVKKEFGKLIVLAYNISENISSEVLFNYVVNFHPACVELYKVKELRELRNNLIHEFHKYGPTEFREEIHRLRHDLFRYLYSQEVIEILYDIEENESSEKINETLKKNFEWFQVEYINGLKEDLISKDEARYSDPHKFPESANPRTTDDPYRSLLDKCLKFIIILDHAEEDNNHQNQSSESRTKFHASQKKEIFDELNKIHSSKNGLDESARTKRKTELRDKCRIPLGRFRRVCNLFVAGSESLFEDTKTEQVLEQIRSILQILIKIKADYNLPNILVILLYDKHLRNKELFDHDTKQDFLIDPSARKGISEKFRSLPPDKEVNIQIGTEHVLISCEKVFRDVLDTFYSVYYKRAIEFHIEEIFNNDTVINYLVENKTEEKEIERLVNRYLKLTLMIDRDRLKNDETSTVEPLNGENRRKIFQEFYKLKKLKKHIITYGCDTRDYEEKVEDYKVLVRNFGIDIDNFIVLEEFCINQDYELIVEEEDLKMIKKVIKLKEELSKVFGTITNEQITSLWSKMPKKEWKGLSTDEKEAVKIMREVRQILFERDNWFEKKVNIILAKKSWTTNIWTFTDDMREAFGEELQPKPRNDMMIEKLLKKETNYTAPYIAKLLTKEQKVGNERKQETENYQNNLKTLVEIFLDRKDGLYVKHLNELLQKKGEDFNLYEKVCDKIAVSDFDISSVKRIFEEFQHAENILSILTRRIKSGQSYDETVDLAHRVLDLLIYSVYKNISEDRADDYKNVLKILECALKLIREITSTSKKPAEGKRMEKDEILTQNWLELVDLEIQLKQAKVLIFQGTYSCVVGSDADNKYEAALEILRKLPKHDLNPPQSLLALSHEAWALSSLKRYEESCTRRKELLEKIVQYATKEKNRDGSKLPRYKNLIVSSNEYKEYLRTLCSYSKEVISDESRGRNKESEISRKLKGRYKNFLAGSFGEYEKYLNTSYIEKEVALDRLSHGRNEKLVEKCQLALGLFNTLYSDRNRPESQMRQLHDIATAHMAISDLMFSESKYRDALENARNACIKNFTVFEFQREMYRDYHPAVKKRIEDFMKYLKRISSCIEKIGDMKSLDDEKKEFSEGLRKFLDQITVRDAK